jgi:hypothetical protein
MSPVVRPLSVAQRLRLHAEALRKLSPHDREHVQAVLSVALDDLASQFETEAYKARSREDS